MPGISIVSSITPTQNQILETVLSHHVPHTHAQHSTTAAATVPQPSLSNQAPPGSVSNATPTSSEILEVMLNEYLLNQPTANGAPAGVSLANQLATASETGEINETA